MRNVQSSTSRVVERNGVREMLEMISMFPYSGVRVSSWRRDGSVAIKPSISMAFKSINGVGITSSLYSSLVSMLNTKFTIDPSTCASRPHL